jgi:uncharacterized membrane protein required for colicin V production
MGLDVTLGLLVLLGGIRGWVRGFMIQAVRLAALVACVYVADPTRDLARPLAREYLPGIRPEILDRLLWWSSAVVALVVLSGIGSIFVHLSRRRPYGQREPGRTDRGAGFALGAAKAAVVACFLVSGIAKFGPDYAPKVGDWAVQQIETSQSLALSKRYRPAEQIWKSVPVQHLVSRVRDRGLMAAPDPKEMLLVPVDQKAKAETAAARPTPDRAKAMSIPAPRRAGGDPVMDEIREDLRRARAEIDAAKKSR